MALNVDQHAPQNMHALAKGDAYRLARAARRRHIRALPRPDAYDQLADLILELPPELETLTIGVFLTWPIRAGRSVAQRSLRQINADQLWGLPISEGRALGKLSMRQALVVAQWLRGEAVRLRDREAA